VADFSGIHIRDKIQLYADELSRKYGKKVHEAFVDQKLFEDAKLIAKS